MGQVRSVGLIMEGPVRTHKPLGAGRGTDNTVFRRISSHLSKEEWAQGPGRRERDFEEKPSG